MFQAPQQAAPELTGLEALCGYVHLHAKSAGSPPKPAMQGRLGSHQFEIVKELGRGMSGIAKLAKQRWDGKQIVIKEVP